MLKPMNVSNARAFAVMAGLATVLTGATSFSQTPSVQSRWNEFQADTRGFMDKMPAKVDARGRLIRTNPNARFGATDIRTGNFIEKKTSYRLGDAPLSNAICDAAGVCIRDIRSGRAAARQRVTDFLDLQEFRAKGVTPVATLDEMDAGNLKTASLDETPWSDTYWPIYQGILGARYADRQFNAASSSSDWKSYHDYVMGSSALFKTIAARGESTQINNLSPAEKYDLLLGNIGAEERASGGYLTPKMWSEGERYFASAGKVETWMGICHGWATAAYMLPRPKNTIVTLAADGRTDITFFPSDLKGLGSYLWAKADVASRFLGGRCDTKNPPKDPQTGRILDEKCFDTNPGNWHVAIVNQIGLAKRSFVMDATYDYEVWNQPVHAYQYDYFNPETGAAGTLDSATIPVAEFTKDKFKRFRSPNTAYVVGIQMTVTYVVETSPTHALTDGPDDDATQKVSYLYDLELNADKQIIGGEWYSNAHPDFLWSPSATARATSYGDSQVASRAANTWTPGQPLPRFWRDIAIATATRFAQPLAAIVEPLMLESHKDQ